MTQRSVQHVLTVCPLVHGPPASDGLAMPTVAFCQTADACLRVMQAFSEISDKTETVNFEHCICTQFSMWQTRLF